MGLVEKFKRLLVIWIINEFVHQMKSLHVHRQIQNKLKTFHPGEGKQDNFRDTGPPRADLGFKQMGDFFTTLYIQLPSAGITNHNY